MSPGTSSLDELTVHWRRAFDTADDALSAAARCRPELGFGPGETPTRRSQLRHERSEVAALLEQIARQEHVALRRPLSAPRATNPMLGLPREILGCVFDLDGVLTASSTLHAQAWAETFDEFLFRRAERTGERFAPFRPFDPATEYEKHLRGRPRVEGVHAFLASRGIRIRTGRPGDPPDAETVYGLASRKNVALARRLEHEGVEAYLDSRRYLEAAHEAGLRCAVVSASANSDAILARAGLDSLLDERVDGNTMASERLRPGPAPDLVLAACRRLAIAPPETVLFDTTTAGIEGGVRAGCGLLVGVERTGRTAAFRASGADFVVRDLAALLDPELE